MQFNSTHLTRSLRDTPCNSSRLPSTALQLAPRHVTITNSSSSRQSTIGSSRQSATVSSTRQRHAHHSATVRLPRTTVRCCSTSQPPAAAADVEAAATAEQAEAGGGLSNLPACQAQDILKATTADGSEMFLEVLSSGSSSSSSSLSQQQQCIAVAHEGVMYHLQPSPTPSSSSSSSSSSEQQQQQQQGDAATTTPWLLQPQGWVLQPDSDLVKALPGWPAAVQQQQARQQLPQQQRLLQQVSKICSAAALTAAVQQNPGPWRDGTGPSDPPVRGLQYQTLCAGEIEALLEGQRGVVMVQLWVGWDSSAPQPVYNCLVLHGLRRALARRDVSIFMSSAAGGLGLTAILAAKAEPFRSWGAHLASFGGQAALVADSPFYKLLIGRILGYAEPNIKHHILATTGKPVSAEVSAAVDKELRGLSKVKPRMPWTMTAEASGGGGGVGQQQVQQQLSRSARKKQQGR